MLRIRLATESVVALLLCGGVASGGIICLDDSATSDPNNAACLINGLLELPSGFVVVDAVDERTAHCRPLWTATGTVRMTRRTSRAGSVRTSIQTGFRTNATSRFVIRHGMDSGPTPAAPQFRASTTTATGTSGRILSARRPSSPLAARGLPMTVPWWCREPR